MKVSTDLVSRIIKGMRERTGLAGLALTQAEELAGYAKGLTTGSVDAFSRGREVQDVYKEPELPVDVLTLEIIAP